MPSKSRLTQTVFLTKAADIRLFKMKGPRRNPLTTKNLPALANAFK